MTDPTPTNGKSRKSAKTGKPVTINEFSELGELLTEPEAATAATNGDEPFNDPIPFGDDEPTDEANAAPDTGPVNEPPLTELPALTACNQRLADIERQRKEADAAVQKCQLALTIDNSEKRQAALQAAQDTLIEIMQEQADELARQKQLRIMQQDAVAQRERDHLAAEARSIHIELGFDYETDPLMAASLLSAMADRMQYALEQGRPFFLRTCQQLPDLDANGQPLDTIEGAERNYDVEMRHARLIEERQRMKVYLIALKQRYDQAYKLRDPNASWFPAFLRRTNAQVRADIEKREAQRLTTFIEQRVQLRKQTAEYYAGTDIMPDFN